MCLGSGFRIALEISAELRVLPLARQEGDCLMPAAIRGPLVEHIVRSWGATSRVPDP